MTLEKTFHIAEINEWAKEIEANKANKAKNPIEFDSKWRNKKESEEKEDFIGVFGNRMADFQNHYDGLIDRKNDRETRMMYLNLLLDSLGWNKNTIKIKDNQRVESLKSYLTATLILKEDLINRHLFDELSIKEVNWKQLITYKGVQQEASASFKKEEHNESYFLDSMEWIIDVGKK